MESSKKNRSKKTDGSEKTEDGHDRIDPPKRFLTAYNFFFMHERAAFLGSQEGNSTPTPPLTLPSTLNVAEHDWMKKTKCERKKSDDKISFSSLSKLIASRWKNLSSDEKAVYEDLAHDDLARYRRDLREYKKKLQKKEAQKKQLNTKASSSRGREKNALIKSQKEQKVKKEELPITKPSSSSSKEPISVTAVPSSSEEPIAATSFSVSSKKPHEMASNSVIFEKIPTVLMPQMAPPNSAMQSISPQECLVQVHHQQASLHQTCQTENSTPNSNTAEPTATFTIPLFVSSEKLAKASLVSTGPGSVSMDTNNIDEIESIAMDSFTAGSLANGSLALMSFADDDNGHENKCSLVHENLTTRVFCLSDPQNKFEGLTGYVAVKTLTDQFPASEQISRFENEFKMTQYLSKCQATRVPFRYDQNDGWHTMYIEWVTGITLKEWINSAHNMEFGKFDNDADGNFDFSVAVRLAWVVSKALAEIHECGVVHNNIIPENIIVSVNEDNGSFSVKFIGFGLASFVQEHDNGPDQIMNDLLALGAVFFQLFSSMDQPSGSDQLTTVSGNYPQDQNVYSSFSSKVPSCISTLVFNLIQKRGQHLHYRSVREVDQDLYVMLTDPTHFLLDQSIGRSDGQLKFPTDKLYGRDHHLSVLADAYGRISQKGGQSEMILVSGSSGAGKSALLQKFKTSVAVKGGYFLYCKFHNLQHKEPLSSIVAAFADLCDEISSKDEETLQQTRTALQKELGSEGDVLANLIPTFHKIMGTPTKMTVDIGGIEAQNRLRFAFKLFVRTISNPIHPLVLFMDDMQWADSLSLELITNLITDDENRSLLLIGTHLDNGVADTHPFQDYLRNIENKNIPNNKMKVDYLDRKHLNELVSDTLQMPPLLVQPLTDAVYRKTSGNIMFVLQFLRSLLDEGLLRFSFDLHEWQWDSESILSKNIADDAVELMSRKILKLPLEAQVALKFLACLGFLCEELKLCFVNDNGSEGSQKGDASCIRCDNVCYSYKNLIEWLDFAVSEGLVNFVTSKYAFSHDQIQLAAINLIPDNERGILHLQIGNHILANNAAASEKNLFTAVSQLNQGAAFITDKSQRIELAWLNARIGEKIVSSAVYPLAATYLEAGMALLDNECWEEHYNLCLKLYVSSAETHYCNGDFEKMKKVLDVIFAKARCFVDKRAAYTTLLHARGAQGKMHEAIQVVLIILEGVGEPFPTLPDEEAILADHSKTKQMLATKTPAIILALPTMKDENKIAAMQVLSSLFTYCFLAKSNLLPLCAFRMVQLTLSHGVCKNSTIGFACFGVLLSGSFGDVKGAYYFGQLSLRLLDKLQANECLARLYLAIYCLINHWVEPHRASLDPLKYAFQVGMRYGDIQHALLCAQQYCINSYSCGVELSVVEEKLREYGSQMKLYKQELILIKGLPHRQAILNLMGRSNNPVELTGDAMNQNDVLGNALENKNYALVYVIYHLCSWLAYLFGNHELASEMAEKGQAIVDTSCSPTLSVTNHAFVEGLSSLALARKTGLAKWKILSERSIKKMEKWAEHAPCNFQHKLCLLRAESAFIMGENTIAEQSYDAAIENARDNGFIQEQALAHERAGIFYWAQGNASKASHHYGQAHESYLKWGAEGKADHLRINCPL